MQYFILLLLILAGQIAVAVIAYTNSTQYTQLIADVWNLNPQVASDFQNTVCRRESARPRLFTGARSRRAV